MKNINDKIAIGAFWSLLTRLTIKSLGIVSTAILARLLWPEDFGLIAIVMLLVAFLEIFTSFGFDINIIQKDNVTDETLNSAWTCKALSGLLITVMLLLGSQMAGEYFNDSRLPLLVIVVAFIPLLKSLENIGFVLYRKELDLKKEFKLEVVAKIVSFTVTIVSAYVLKSYWALVIGIYVNTITKLLMSFLMHPYRPSLSLKEAKDLFSFSKWLLLNNVLIFLNHKITDIILGKLTTPTDLGYYTISFEISNLPTTQLVFPLSRAIFPGYSKIKNDIVLLRDTFIKFTKVVMLFASPICFGMVATADELVHVLLGDKWLATIPIISLLAFYGLIRCSVQNTGSIYLALGKPKIPVIISTGRLFLIVPLLLYLVPEEGPIGAAKSILFVSCITAPIGFIIVSKLIALSFKQLVGIFIFPVFASIIMYFLISCYELFVSVTGEKQYIISLLVKMLIGCTFYLCATCLYVKFFPKNNVAHSLFIKIQEKLYKKF